MIEDYKISSGAFEQPRKVWVQPSKNPPASRCLIFLDAELYLDQVGAMNIVEQAAAENPDHKLTCVYLSSFDAAARHADFTCNDRFTSFLAMELRPWIERTVAPHGSYYLCGLSLSALAAAYAACQRPESFTGAICQSPSAWWKNEWFNASVHLWDLKKTRLWLSVGQKEVQDDLWHQPTGLYQGSSQLDSCRRLAKNLEKFCPGVSYHETEGAHETANWAPDLAAALRWL